MSWFNDLSTMTRPPGLDESRAVAFLDAFPAPRGKRYEAYFAALRPQTDEDVFRRAIFAFASVHTTWKLNCVLYESLWDLGWRGSLPDLKARVRNSGAGLHNNRAKALWKFTADFWASPSWFRRDPREDWFDYRDRIMRKVHGLGLAKSAFFSELLYFEDSDATCFDVHMLRLYGTIDSDESQRTNDRFLRYAERHWAQACRARGLAPVTARWVYWDVKQGKEDSRYWSKVLEGSPIGKFVSAKQMELGL